MKPVTCASISNCKNTSVRDATTVSFALLLALAAGPVRRMSGAGSSYFTSAVSNNCSGRLAATVFSLSWVTGATGTSTVNSSSKLSSSNSSSSSSGSFHAATTGVSKAGVSVISNSSSTRSRRSGFFDQSQLLSVVILVITSETGVAVATKTPKINTMIRTG